MKCRRCGNAVEPGNAYCPTCSQAMARRAEEMEAAAQERASKPKVERSNLLKAVTYVTVIGALVSISPYLFFRAQEKVAGAGKEFTNLTDVRSVGEAQVLARRSHESLGVGRAQRTASLEAAMTTGTDADLTAPTTSVSAEPKVKPDHFPPTVSAWIDSFKAIEEERKTLAVSQMKTGSAATDEDRVKLAGEFEDQWIQLLHKFEKNEIPPRCEDLAAAYSRTLRETGNVVVGKIRHLQPHATTVSNEDTSVLVAPAQDADQLLRDVCSKFDSSKDFIIDAHIQMPKSQ